MADPKSAAEFRKEIKEFLSGTPKDEVLALLIRMREDVFRSIRREGATQSDILIDLRRAEALTGEIEHMQRLIRSFMTATELQIERIVRNATAKPPGTFKTMKIQSPPQEGDAMIRWEVASEMQTGATWQTVSEFFRWYGKLNSEQQRAIELKADEMARAAGVKRLGDARPLKWLIRSALRSGLPMS